MITLEEFYDKVMSDREIMEGFAAAAQTHSLSDFAKTYECVASEDEIREYFIKMRNNGQNVRELSDDELENVAGGFFDFGKWISDLFNSIFGGGSSSSASDKQSTSNTRTTKTFSGTNNQKTSSIIGGGMVNFNDVVPQNRIVGKGIVGASGGGGKNDFYGKM